MEQKTEVEEKSQDLQTPQEHKNFFRDPKKLREVKKYLFILSIIGIQLINFVIFYVIQNGNSILMAFQLKKRGQSYWTLDNFKRVYTQFFGDGANSSELMLALKNTFKFFALSLVMFPIAFCTSYFMYKKIYGYRGLQIIFFVPGLVSGVVWSMLYKELMGVNGPIVDMLQFLTGADEPYLLLGDTRYALKTVMLYSVWFGIAGNFVLYGGALSRIPTELIEVGKLDGITWYRELVQVIVPLVWPTISTLLILSMTGLFTASGNILYLTNGAFGTNTISFLIFQNVYGNQLTSNTYNYAACVGICFTVLTLPIVFISRWLLNKVEDVEY